MPLYEAKTHEGMRITSVKLDGVEVLKEYYINAANTDEGWIEVYETEIGLDGKKHIKMTPWREGSFEVTIDGVQCVTKSRRDFIFRRLHGKVEVVVGEAPAPA